MKPYRQRVREDYRKLRLMNIKTSSAIRMARHAQRNTRHAPTDDNGL